MCSIPFQTCPCSTCSPINRRLNSAAAVLHNSTARFAHATAIHASGCSGKGLGLGHQGRLDLDCFHLLRRRHQLLRLRAHLLWKRAAHRTVQSVCPSKCLCDHGLDGRKPAHDTHMGVTAKPAALPCLPAPCPLMCDSHRSGRAARSSPSSPSSRCPPAGKQHSVQVNFAAGFTE